MFSFQPFSKPRLVSIGLLLAILVISLMFSSYVEGMSENTDAVAIVNKDAPLSKDKSEDLSKDLSKDLSSKDLSSKDLSSKDKSKDLKPLDGIHLGGSKTLSVTDITGLLKNNAGVQKLIDNAQKPINSV
jgi:hypothetical protein